MKFNNILTNTRKVFHNVGFWTKKNSPELLIVAGILSAGAAVVLGCVATKKLDKKLKPTKEKIAEIHTNMDNQNLIEQGLYTVAEGKRELAKTYAKGAWEIVKLYSPAVITFGLSVASILSSHHILKGRELAAAAAYTTIEAAYKNYRERVKDKIGEQAESDIFHNVTEKTIEVEETDKKGNKKVVTKKVKVRNDDPNDYSYCFDCSNPNWEPYSNGFNLDWLLMQEKLLNNKFRIQGYMFLDEVYKTLGIEPGLIGERKMLAARHVGWIYDPEDPTRDNYISFGLSDVNGNLTSKAMDMKRFGERDVWLEFNVDGDILTDEKNFAKYARCW